jgi:hypothetical protein
MGDDVKVFGGEVVWRGNETNLCVQFSRAMTMGGSFMGASKHRAGHCWIRLAT